MNLLRSAVLLSARKQRADQQSDLATISMILGLGSVAMLILSFAAQLFFLWVVAIPVAILAIIFGAKCFKKDRRAKLGVFTGGLSLAFIIVGFILLAAAFSGFSFE